MMMMMAHQVVHQRILLILVLDIELDVELLVDFERPGGEVDVQVVLAGRGHEPQDLLLHHGAGLDLLQMKEVEHW